MTNDCEHSFMSDLEADGGNPEDAGAHGVGPGDLHRHGSCRLCGVQLTQNARTLGTWLTGPV